MKSSNHLKLPIRFEVYKDKSAKWRWRMIARNGLIIADGSQGYSRKSSVDRAIRKLLSNVFELYMQRDVDFSENQIMLAGFQE